LIHNERTKLPATALNGTALASIAAGFITPLAAISFDVPGSADRGALTTTLFALARLVTGRRLTSRSTVPAREPAGMSGSDLYLMALGPILALAAGLFIFVTATRGTRWHDRKTLGPGNSHRIAP
jgi:hypothetical protein